ncbi:DUF397 domain-containing protein [Streptomyces corynorhini]|uniref:DUF397 domain-containing protein n=1 Tax=Streptomyces corynorhini TaxID=2282652 RepID=A0A370BAW2_9ACTN|nr:DUF397 domain-containing protein [Streptomyces corynorhini]RDG37314.1 DUF397 domain-containing protein [Streptomyces corynorhini]
MKTEDTADQLSDLAWFKSSYSGSDGGDCVEVAWFKSSYTGSDGGNCVEVAVAPTTIHIRDSKRTQGPVLQVPTPAWTDFITFAGPARNTYGPGDGMSPIPAPPGPT